MCSKCSAFNAVNLQVPNTIYSTISGLLSQVLKMLSLNQDKTKIILKFNESSFIIRMNVFLKLFDGLSIIMDGIICLELSIVRL